MEKLLKQELLLIKLSDKYDESIRNQLFHISIFNYHKNTWHPPTLWIGLGCERNTSKN